MNENKENIPDKISTIPSVSFSENNQDDSLIFNRSEYESSKKHITRRKLIFYDEHS
jgi:hypothetical protein